jgi:pyrimidine deaminase RibD-like protein
VFHVLAIIVQKNVMVKLENAKNVDCLKVITVRSVGLVLISTLDVNNVFLSTGIQILSTRKKDVEVCEGNL